MDTQRRYGDQRIVRAVVSRLRVAALLTILLARPTEAACNLPDGREVQVAIATPPQELQIAAPTNVVFRLTDGSDTNVVWSLVPREVELGAVRASFVPPEAFHGERRDRPFAREYRVG